MLNPNPGVTKVMSYPFYGDPEERLHVSPLAKLVFQALEMVAS